MREENVASIYTFINFLSLLVLHAAMRGAIPAIIRQRRGAVETSHQVITEHSETNNHANSHLQ